MTVEVFDTTFAKVTIEAGGRLLLTALLEDHAHVGPLVAVVLSSGGDVSRLEGELAALGEPVGPDQISPGLSRLLGGPERLRRLDL
jgi:hypothetical protein